MSRNAEAWFYDECDIRGNLGWVLVDLCYHANDDGYTWPGKTTIAKHARLSDSSVWRALAELEDRGQLARVDPDDENAPKRWLAIPVNRRPVLYRLPIFLGSRFATPRSAVGVAAGVAKRPSRGRVGVATRRSDVDVRDANRDQESDNRDRARDADPDCTMCQGRGRVYVPSPGPDGEPFDRRCVCTKPGYERAPSKATRPVVGFGMPANRRKGA